MRTASPASSCCRTPCAPPPISTTALSTSCSSAARICATCRSSSARSACKSILPKDPLLTYSEHWPEHGKRLFKEAQKLGLEGIMAKRAQSRYLSGARSKDWLKIKTGKRQEVVIVGFTAPQAITSAFRVAGAGRAREGRLALCRSCRDRVLACHARRAAREAVAAAYGLITVQAAREGRGRPRPG